jgi:hypothetical protein
MWIHGRHHATRVDGFFRLGQGHDSLPNYYTLNFQLMKHHNWNLDTLENMMPFERDIYVILLKQWLEEELRKQKQGQG